LLLFLAGDGTGGFAPAIGSSNGVVGLNADSIAVGDLDGDGMLDLAVGCYYSGTYGVELLRGIGDGTFTNFTRLFFDEKPIICDLNGDDIPDIMTSLGAGVAIRLGLGGGQFTSKTNLATQLAPGGGARIAIADLNGDGRPDFVVGSRGGNLVDVFLNQTAPSLNITPVDNCVQLSWPNWTYNLEYRTNLTSGNDWAAVAGILALSAGRKVMTNLVDRPAQFYRLKQQQAGE